MAIDVTTLRSEPNRPSIEAIVQYLNENPFIGGAFGSALLHAQDEKDNDVAGGTFTQDAWRTRDLNTAPTNEITGASLDSNQVTLPAGTYWAEWSVSSYRIDYQISRLYDTTGTAELGRGTSESTFSTSGSIRSFGNIRFTLAITSAIELQHACSLTRADTGYGHAAVTQIANVSGNNVYSILKIWKVG